MVLFFLLCVLRALRGSFSWEFQEKDAGRAFAVSGFDGGARFFAVYLRDLCELCGKLLPFSPRAKKFTQKKPNYRLTNP
jgi:hypothetical protein